MKKILNERRNNKYTTLTECFRAKVEEYKNTLEGIVYIDLKGEEVKDTYESLYTQSYHLLGVLQEKGLKKGDYLILQLSEEKDFIASFWACILGGIIAIPLATTSEPDTEAGKKFIRICNMLNSPYVLIDAEEDILWENSSNSALTLRFQDLICDTSVRAELPVINTEDVAYIQFSSGSTGNPKGVVLKHINLVNNVEQIICRAQIGESDIIGGWMPLTHDMGLIGFHIIPLYAHINQYRMLPSVFIKKPNMFIKKISDHFITMTSSPNFALNWIMDRFDPKKLEGVDLSCLKLIFDGAEPILMEVVRKFENKFASYGLRENVIYQVYGLAEACLAVSFMNPAEEEKSIYINRNNNLLGNKVEFVDMEDKNASEFAIVGNPLDEIDIRITDESYNNLEDLVIGCILIKGPNVFTGYFGGVSGELWNDGYFNTGDIGFIYKNMLVVTGRMKDIIFVNGQNYFAHDLENLILIKGIPNVKETVVVVDYDQVKGKDDVYVLVRYRGNNHEFQGCVEQVQEVFMQQFKFLPKEVLPIKTVLKTTSGKPKRYLMLQNLKNERYSDNGVQDEEVSI